MLFRVPFILHQDQESAQSIWPCLSAWTSRSHEL